MARICIVTPGQPSTSPRVVKEADALSEAGHSVVVIGGYWSNWADRCDQRLLAARPWSFVRVGGHPMRKPLTYWYTRASHKVLRTVGPRLGDHGPPPAWYESRVGIFLERYAARVAADLYIAHYAATMPAAIGAASSNGAVAIYDAEDWEGESPVSRGIERNYIRSFSCVTASSPEIGSLYRNEYGVCPTTILNVFPAGSRISLPARRDVGTPLSLYWFSQTVGPGRGIEDVLLAMGRLRDREIVLHLRGRWAAGYRVALGRLVSRCGLDPSRVVQHEPACPGEMVRLAEGYDVGLALEVPTNVARSTCLTNKLFTYVLAGNALVLTETAAQAAIAKEVGSAALCYRAGDIAPLASRLRLWHDDRDALLAARVAVARCGDGRYNWEVEKGKFLSVVDTVLGVRARSHA